MRDKVTYKKGEAYPLDMIYRYLGIIPIDTYEQDDISDWSHTNSNDSGETIKFTKTVTVDVKVTVKS